MFQKMKRRKKNKGERKMSKNIKLDKSFIEEAKADFIKMCDEGKFIDGKIVFNRTIGMNTGKKAKLFVENLAWNKMKALVDEFDKEIAWHGIAKRYGDAEGEYIIEDIMVYPQTVTGATVTTDQEKYQMWLYEHEDDVFNNIRMQGHSHVNMGVSPSGVDTTYYDRIVEQMKDDMFYIFMILNKKGNRYISIYDKKINTIFETSDVTVTLLIDPDDPINNLIKDAKEKVKDEPVRPVTSYVGTKYATPQSYGAFQYYGNNNNYANNYTGGIVNNPSPSSVKSKPIVSASSIIGEEPYKYSSPIPGISQEEYEDMIRDPYGAWD